MKTTFRLPVILALGAAVFTFCPGPGRAADDDLAPRRAQAELLLNAMHTEQILTNATTKVYQMVDKFGQNAVAQPNVPAEQKAAVQKAQEDAHAAIGQQLSWDAVKGDFIQAYAEAFSEDDLKGLVAFYNSPLGQKLVEKQPAVTEKMGRLTQQKMMAVMPAIMQKIKEAAQKPSPTPAVSAMPATPTSSPAP